MGTQDSSEIIRKNYKYLKGTISFGDLNATFNLTGGLSEQQFIAKMKGERSDDYFVCRNGKIMMPNLGIY